MEVTVWAWALDNFLNATSSGDDILLWVLETRVEKTRIKKEKEIQGITESDVKNKEK